jgi:hypothetical protein
MWDVALVFCLAKNDAIPGTTDFSSNEYGLALAKSFQMTVSILSRLQYPSK